MSTRNTPGYNEYIYIQFIIHVYRIWVICKVATSEKLLIWEYAIIIHLQAITTCRLHEFVDVLKIKTTTI